MASNRVLALSRDTTQPVAGFLIGCNRALSEWIEKHALDHIGTKVRTRAGSTPLTAYHQKIIPSTIRDVRNLIQDIFDYVRLPRFDEGIFQVYLSIATSLATRCLADQTLHAIGKSLSTYLSDFNASWKLSTGSSMEILWNHFRPPTAKNLQHLDLVIKVEKIAEDFDLLIRGSNVHFEVLSDMRGSITQILSRIKSSESLAPDLLEVSKLFAALHSRH